MEEIIDSFSKGVYNTYLKVTSKYKDRGYRKRQNFDNFEKNGYILKLSDFFKRYHHIDIEKFFSAPYEIWETKENYGIDFYTKRKALRCYINYKKYLINLPPDHNDQVKHTICSFHFIKHFCKQEGITVGEYLNHTKGIYSFLTHLKNDDVNIYALFGFDGFKNKFKTGVDSELKRMLYSDLYLDYDIMYRKWMASQVNRNVVKLCLQKLLR